MHARCRTDGFCQKPSRVATRSARNFLLPPPSRTILNAPALHRDRSRSTPGAKEEGLNNQVVAFKRAPPIPRHARNAAEIRGFRAAVLKVRIHLPPAVSQANFGTDALPRT